MSSKSFAFAAITALAAGASGPTSTSVAFAAQPEHARPSGAHASHSAAISLGSRTHEHGSLPTLTLAQSLEATTAISKARSNPEVSELVKQLHSLDTGVSLQISANTGPLTVAKTSDGYTVEGAYADRSICGHSIATVLYGRGAVALFALAAALGPGEVAVIAGVEMAAEQLGYAAAASGSLSALAAWPDAKFCS